MSLCEEGCFQIYFYVYDCKCVLNLNAWMDVSKWEHVIALSSGRGSGCSRKNKRKQGVKGALKSETDA